MKKNIWNTIGMIFLPVKLILLVMCVSLVAARVLRPNKKYASIKISDYI